MTKRKVQKYKQLSTEHTQKTKDRVTRTPLKTGLGFIYWILTFVLKRKKKRYIDGSSTSSTKELSMTMTHMMPAVKEGLQSYCDKGGILL